MSALEAGMVPAPAKEQHTRQNISSFVVWARAWGISVRPVRKVQMTNTRP